MISTKTTTNHGHSEEPILVQFDELSIKSLDLDRIRALPSEDVIKCGEATYHQLVCHPNSNVRLGFLEVADRGNFTFDNESIRGASLSSGGSVLLLLKGALVHEDGTLPAPGSVVLPGGAIETESQPHFIPGSIVLVAHFGPYGEPVQESYALELEPFVQFGVEVERLDFRDSGHGYRQHLLPGNSDLVWMGFCDNPKGRTTEVKDGDPGGQFNLFLPRDGDVVHAIETHPSSNIEIPLHPGTLLLEAPGASRKILYPAPGANQQSLLAMHIAFL